MATTSPVEKIIIRSLSFLSCCGFIALQLVSTSGAVDASDDLQWDVSGQVRVRYEGMDGQFRANGVGIDDLLLTQSFLKVRATRNDFSLNFEAQDSRTYFAEDTDSLSSSLLNAADILQLNVEANIADVFGIGSKTKFKLGRQTIKFSSERQLSRPGFSNVAWAFTGAYTLTEFQSGSKLHALFVVPVERKPSDQEALHNNSQAFDKEDWHKQIWALHYMTPIFDRSVTAEAYIYGFHEQDTDSRATANRNYINPGFRLVRSPQEGQWHFDVEGSWRFGSRYASSDALDDDKLDVNATLFFARVGYSFGGDWKLKISGQYYWASGDDDPDDDTYGQYDRLYSSRRTDLNNTSIHGPLAPVNLSAPGIRFEVKPSKSFDARVTYSHASLASATSPWVQGKLHDPTGQSGRFLGHAFDSRFRYHILPGQLTFDVGASLLIHGEFAKNAPDASPDSRTLYGYGQVVWKF